MTAPTPPDYSAWKYRATIRITNPVAAANFQHQLTLTWKPGMRSDFRDIRFTQQNGLNCPYWIESKTDRSTATVWVKVPSASQTILFLYFGNGQVASASSGVNTFDFFDDFASGALDTSKWSDIKSEGVTITGGVLTCTADSAAVHGIASANNMGATITIRARVNPHHPNSTSYLEGMQARYGDDTHNNTVYFSHTSSSYNLKYYQNAGGSANAVSITGVSGAAWYVSEAKMGASSTIWTINDANSVTQSTSYYATSGKIRIIAYASGAIIDCDWVLARKHTATEPTLSLIITGPNPLLPRHPTAGITLGVGTEYAFDPVNIDHGMAPGSGGDAMEWSLAAINIAHGMSVSAGAQDVECGAVNIYHPIYPTASWAQIIDPVVDSGYLIEVTVSQSMDDAMAEAVFEYDGNEIGGYFSGDYGTKVYVTIPDHLGNNNCVFVGIVPSSRAVYDVAKDRMTVRAVDHGLFLSKQTLDTKDLALLPPSDQTSEGANVAKVLSYDGIVKNFQIGMFVTGSTSRATGTVFEMSGTATRRMTLYPATGKFIDNEDLTVGGVKYAVADGRSVDTSYTPYYEEVMPEDWVRSILRGTGIEPYSIESSSDYWDTTDCPAVPFMFGSLEKKQSALKRVAAYMDYLWHVKPRSPSTGIYVQAGYFIKQTSIDTLLGLPAAATITGPDDFAGPITLDQDGELQVDVVKVRCQDLFGRWMEEIRSNSYYDAGEGPYREFPDEPKDICTRADLAAYATDMYNLYSARTCSWSGTLLARSDLQLYQILNISGLGTEVPDGTYRIIKIAHEHGCAKNLTHITFMLSSAFSVLRKYGMTYKDSISKVQQIAEGLERQKPQTELATVTATDGWTITYTTEAGNKGRGRDSTSTPDVAGNTPVGAKVSVQTMRGGVVCVPIVGASGSSTDLLTVDVPTIISATEDPADANYWFLIWVPGANNTRVSVNYQTTGYPSAPGTVLPYGNEASCRTELYPKTTRKIRIRFSGPSTTYYIKLWGEKNGVYSATGAQATITSGASATPIDSPEEPEPIGVIDELLCAGFVSETPITGDIIFSGQLPFLYNGVDNIYIGGPVSDTTFDFSPFPYPQPVPRYMLIDNYIIITGPNGSIQIGSSGTAGWKAPVNIKNILNVGANTITITHYDKFINGEWDGVSDLWVRTYYL